ncbi:hypothetical protein HT585_20770 [Ensifer sp. HO-A22]|uniref:Uncharacterized protein n=1 Tax=Ensifer oleiphilus TaxID=2742698 RepID=A0A7Y6UQ41_9HYPH|nr:hypothetical protein [Ensifer oleiphilus]NVD41313.1 hypothetical protein [Ensifer oleiphilus]
MDILEFPHTRDQREAQERLRDAMREFNAAVKFAAKMGLEVDVSQVPCYASYSVEPLMLVNVAANIPGKLPNVDVGEF